MVALFEPGRKDVEAKEAMGSRCHVRGEVAAKPSLDSKTNQTQALTKGGAWSLELGHGKNDSQAPQEQKQ